MTNLKDKTLDQKVHFYLVEFKSDQYNFIKLGVTSRSIEERFKPVAYKEYSKDVILDLELCAFDAIELESKLMLMFVKDRYYISSKNSFKGCTELFKLDCKDFILNEVNEFIKESRTQDK